MARTEVRNNLAQIWRVSASTPDTLYSASIRCLVSIFWLVAVLDKRPEGATGCQPGVKRRGNPGRTGKNFPPLSVDTIPKMRPNQDGKFHFTYNLKPQFIGRRLQCINFELSRTLANQVPGRESPRTFQESSCSPAIIGMLLTIKPPATRVINPTLSVVFICFLRERSPLLTPI